MKSNISILLIILSLLFQNAPVYAQKDAAWVDSVITAQLQNRRFTFIAESANPMTGGYRQLTTMYSVTVAGDSIRSELPYFGRAYSAPLNSQGGINFHSGQFDYKSKAGKKGRTEISIKFRDVQDVRQFSFIIYKNGSAMLNVVSNNRQAISFNGRLVTSHSK